MSESTERAAFEAWYEADALMEHSNWFRRDEDGDYLLDTVQSDWRVWQAARASLAEGKAEPAWQPMETAPKDGAFYLAVDGTGCYAVLNEPPGCARGEWFFVKGDWRGAAKDFHPTHWKPLSPPSMDGAVQAATSGGER